MVRLLVYIEKFKSVSTVIIGINILKKILFAFITIALTTSVNAKERTSCKSFKTQQQAQAFYEQRKKSGQSGWKSLDRDRDGKACDCLPGGSGKNCPKSKKK